MSPAEYRTQDETHRICTALNDLLLKNPRRRVGSLIAQAAEPDKLEEIGDGRLVRKINKLLE